MAFSKRVVFCWGCFICSMGMTGARASSLEFENVERPFPYQCMAQYRELARDFLFARKGVKDLGRAIQFEKIFFAGSFNNLEKVTNLEQDLASGSDPRSIPDGAILNLLIDVRKNCQHLDEDLEVKEIPLIDKIAAANEIVVAYQGLLDGQSSYISNFLPYIRFWQRVSRLLSQKQSKE